MSLLVVNNSLASLHRLKSPSRQTISRRSRTGALTAAKDADLKVSGMGSAALDYLALVKAYPSPDQKIRTESFQVQGGGNCGNALTGAAKLGLQPFIITKLGDDSIGSQTLSQLKDEGIDVECAVVAENKTSGFTYIIVDQEGETRTCIHTPMEPLQPSELSSENISRFLENSRIVYFDGRLTETAIVVARKAKELNLKVLVEAERLRPNLEELIELADIIVTSKNFPQDFSGEDCLGDALVSLTQRFPSAQLIITTLGARGSLALEINHQYKQEAEEMVLETALQNGWKQLELEKMEKAEDPDCVAKNGTPIWSGESFTFPQPLCPTLLRSEEEFETVKANMREKAKIAAMADARSASSFSGYEISRKKSTSNVSCTLTLCTASQISKDAIVDTTGAGDAFMSGVLYSLIHGFSLKHLLRFAGLVGACKCTEIGARDGQPILENFRNSNFAHD